MVVAPCLYSSSELLESQDQCPVLAKPEPIFRQRMTSLLRKISRNLIFPQSSGEGHIPLTTSYQIMPSFIFGE